MYSLRYCSNKRQLRASSIEHLDNFIATKSLLELRYMIQNNNHIVNAQNIVGKRGSGGSNSTTTTIVSLQDLSIKSGKAPLAVADL